MSQDPDRLSSSRLIMLSIAGAVVAASCGGNAADAESTTTAGVVTTSTFAATTSTVETTTSTVEATATTLDAAFSEMTDVVYMTVDGVELLMDVYIPEGEGPWPVVVAFHGLDSRGKDSQDNIPVAEAAANQGLLVFAPSWIVWDPPPFPFTIASFEGWIGVTNCAVAFAQQSASELGGDPANTILYGFSAGAGAALIAGVQPTVAPVDGCATEASPTPAMGLVLGDGVYFLHNEDFDAAFDADLAAMQDQVAALIDPTNWPQGWNAHFNLWVAQEGTNPRALPDPSDEAGWLALRDPTGSIRSDLEQLGQLEDGVISTVDAGELLALRAREAGFDVTLDSYPGGHTVANKVTELVGYLKDAAAQ